MKPDSAYRTPLPPENPEWQRSSAVPVINPPVPQATDNAAQPKVLLYGPNGEPLIRQEPRPIGFRERP